MASVLRNLIEKVSGNGQKEGDEDEVTLEDVEELSNGEREEDLELEEEPEDLQDEGDEEGMGEEEMMEEEVETSDFDMEIKEEEAAEPEGEKVEMANPEEMEEIREEMEDLSSQVATAISKAESTEEGMEDFKEKMEKLYMIYELIFKGVNPFKEDYDFSGDVREALSDFVGYEDLEGFVSGGEGMSEEAVEKVEGLERRVNELENKISGEEAVPEGLEEGEEEEGMEGFEDEYEEAFESVGGEEGERTSRWEVGEKVRDPSGERLLITDKNWNSLREKWEYKCKPIGGE